MSEGRGGSRQVEPSLSDESHLPNFAGDDCGHDDPQQDPARHVRSLRDEIADAVMILTNALKGVSVWRR